MEDFEIYEETEAKASNAMGIAGFVLGILSIIGCCCYLSILSIPGIVLSALQLKKTKNNGLAVAGLVLSIIGAIITVILLIGIIALQGNPEWADQLMDQLTITK